jgi:hypothetical protein
MRGVRVTRYCGFQLVARERGHLPGDRFCSFTEISSGRSHLIGASARWGGVLQLIRMHSQKSRLPSPRYSRRIGKIVLKDSFFALPRGHCKVHSGSGVLI